MAWRYCKCKSDCPELLLSSSLPILLSLHLLFSGSSDFAVAGESFFFLPFSHGIIFHYETASQLSSRRSRYPRSPDSGTALRGVACDGVRLNVELQVPNLEQVRDFLFTGDGHFLLSTLLRDCIPKATVTLRLGIISKLNPWEYE